MTRIVEWHRGLPRTGPAVISVGVFDGVHLGHQALIRDAVALAGERGALAAAVTFDRDPDRVVDPAHAAPQLLELDDKLELIGGLGPDVVLVVPFTQEVAALSPDAFCDGLLLAAFAPEAVVVGHDFRFGRGAAGDLHVLETFGRAHRFDVVGHPLVRVDGAPVTSTRIRGLIAAGEVADAARFLGRPHRLRGVVVGGRGEGRRLGAPTANLATQPYAAVPSDGVYAGRVGIEGVTYAAGISVGLPPTFPDAASRLEVHVLDFAGDLYGRTLAVEFIERLRDQRRFDSPEALAEAIASDIERIRTASEDARAL